MSITPEQAKASGVWPFEEALKLLERFKKAPPAKSYALFETGYGPSGLPHIGTFGEVARTLMVRHAFHVLSDIPTKLFAFSDDMDGLRKVPENIPNPEKFQQYAAIKSASKDVAETVGGVVITSVPDPFGTHESYGHHMNARLRGFLDQFGFQYDFKSATDCYSDGTFDATLIKVCEQHEAICNVVKPTLGDARKATYSPIIPIDPETKRTLQVPVTIVDAGKGIIRFQNPLKGDAWMELPVTGGNCKLQWKADWGARWAALGVDYEMYGKDLIPSAELSSKICKILGGTPPEGFNYELFLDEKGEKISKSKGNGISMEQWLQYATPESLSLYMFQSPRKAKKLYFDVIPKAVDEYLTFVEKYQAASADDRLKNPAWHIHSGTVPNLKLPISFALLLNLASACNPESPAVLWGFITKYAPEATPQNLPLLDKLVTYAVRYYDDFVKPNKKFRPATEAERAAILKLDALLPTLPEGDAEAIQTAVYDIGMQNGYAENLRGWFGALYEILLGATQGPRMGSFIALFGVANMRKLIAERLA